MLHFTVEMGEEVAARGPPPTVGSFLCLPSFCHTAPLNTKRAHMPTWRRAVSVMSRP
jgi:hypothetical protein